MLPARGKQHSRIGGVHRHVNDAGAVIHEQHLLPLRATVGGAPQSAIVLRPVAVSLRRRIHDVGIRGMHDHASDASGVLEPHARPVLAGIGAAIDAVANGDVAAQESLARANPHHIRIAGRHRDRTDTRHAQ